MGKNIVITVLAAALVLAVIVNAKQYSKNNKLTAQLAESSRKIAELESARPPFARGERGNWQPPTDENGNPIRPTRDENGNWKMPTDENGNPIMPPNGGGQRRRGGGNRQGGRPDGQNMEQAGDNQPSLPQLSDDDLPNAPLPTPPQE